MYDPRPDEKTSIEAVRKQTFRLFDAMIETGDFTALQQLIQALLSQHR